MDFIVNMKFNNKMCQLLLVLFGDDLYVTCPFRAWWHAYIHSFRSIIEMTEK